MLSRDVELVLERIGLPGGCYVKRFERSNRLDTGCKSIYSSLFMKIILQNVVASLLQNALPDQEEGRNACR